MARIAGADAAEGRPAPVPLDPPDWRNDPAAGSLARLDKETWQMIGKVIGALVGAEVERKREQSGLKGAVVGAMAVGAMRRLGPLGLVLGGAYVAKKAYDRRKAA